MGEELIKKGRLKKKEELNAAKHVLSEFKLYLNEQSDFPFQNRLIQLQSSQIRYCLRAIYNCAEYKLDNIPPWIYDFGSYVDVEPGPVANNNSASGGVAIGESKGSGNVEEKSSAIDEQDEDDEDWFLDQKEREQKKKEKEKMKEEKKKS